MRASHSEPATTIVRKLGGPAKVAHVLGVHRTAVYYWLRPFEPRGTGGMIPYKYMATLIRHAQAQGIKLKPGDFTGRLDQ
jgi:hypothetical protein